MAKTKYIPTRGLAFREEETMEKLSRYARKGWILQDFALFGFKLKKTTPQNLAYNLDFHTNPDEEYFAFFKAAGWTHVCSAGKEMHIFSAPIGTKPIYSDQTTLVEKYEHEQSKFGKYSAVSLVLTVLFFALTILSNTQQLPDIVSYISLPLALISLVMLIFTGMPYFAFVVKVKKLSDK